MISAKEFVSAARGAGFDFYTGVPCSYLTSLINYLEGDATTPYIGATSEGEAVGIAAGAWLAGRLPVVMCQNSGLGNTVNPLTSLNHAFHIPALLVVTWRGKPGQADEPQHEIMGEITQQLLDTIRIGHAPFPEKSSELAGRLNAATAHMRGTGLPFALVTPKDSFTAQELEIGVKAAQLHVGPQELRTRGPLPSRYEILASMLNILPHAAAVIATTGKCGRELFTIADREQHLYLVGSMGCASAVGMGVAANVLNPVVVVDGDGAALMKMGNLATIGAHAPENLVHIVLDNGVHDSTGGQGTVSSFVDFASVAASCNYRTAARCDDIPGFERALASTFEGPGPHFLHIQIRPGSLEKLGRPTIGPVAVAQRFKSFLSAKQEAPRKQLAG